MPSLLPARWSTSESKPVRLDASLFDEAGEWAMGFEAACPALQLEGWDLPAQAARPHEPSIN